jgi:glutaminyl-tRNA synthetase
MAHPNMKMRDPLIYRIRHISHYRTGDTWCIYPMYDFTHCLSDSIEGITHSLCTLEFENNRELYDWFLDALRVECHPQQIEFARLNLSHTILSKRRLVELVEGGHVNGWDDPRLPTLSGLRRRGYTPEAIRDFLDRIGISKRDGVVDASLLDYCLREHLNRTSPRAFAVLRPLKVVIENYPQDEVEELECINNPEDPAAGTRRVPFGREIYIEREDFREDPPRKFFRLAPGREVRLRYAYFLKCERCIKDPNTGEIRELRCTYDPATRGGDAPDGRRVKATLHWVSARHAVPAELRLYDKLFTEENPLEAAGDGDYRNLLNPASREILTDCRVEPSLAAPDPGRRYQFERQGYFCADPDSRGGLPVFNRTVTLRDAWARLAKRMEAGKH